MSRIVVGPVTAMLEGAPEVRAAVSAALSVRDPGAERTWRYQNGRWDGVVRFMSPYGLFPSGLTWRAAAAVREVIGVAPLVKWPDTRPGEPLAQPLAVEWRPYQIDAVEKALRARRMVVQCPTRGGKTEVGIEFIRRVGGRALWVTHTRELLWQTAARFRDRLGVEPAVVGDGTSWRSGSDVTVGMVQTISSAVKAGSATWLRDFDVLVMDEAHHAGANTWQAVARACVNAPWRLGLSGTAATGDPVADMMIEGALGPTYTVATTSELADMGFVARPRVVVLTASPRSYPSYEEVREAVCPSWRDDPRQLSSMGGELFREAYRLGITENGPRNQLAAETAVRHALSGEKFLILCNRVPHARALYEMVRSRGVSTWALFGEDASDVRRVVLNQFKLIKCGAVLVCTPFFREGVDVPQIDVGMLAGGGESDVAVLQALGRMLTVRLDKKEVLVYDFADGRDPEARKDYLARHFWHSRLPLYERSGFEVERQ